MAIADSSAFHDATYVSDSAVSDSAVSDSADSGVTIQALVDADATASHGDKLTDIFLATRPP